MIRRLREDVLPLLADGRSGAGRRETFPLEQAQEAYERVRGRRQVREDRHRRREHLGTIARKPRIEELRWKSTSPFSAVGPAATPQRSAPPSSARRSPASRRSPSSAARACASGCIPTKAWVQTAHFLHQANDTFGKLGVSVDEPQLDFGAANEWKAGVVKQMTGGVAGALQGERRRVGQGLRQVQGREHDRGRGRGGRHLQVGDRRDRARSRCARRSRASSPTSASTRPACSRRPRCRGGS